MAPQGRRPLPAKIHRQNGMPGHRGLADDIDPPALLDLNPPERLSPLGKEAWLELAPRLSQVGVLSNVDDVALVQLCEAINDYAEASAVLEKEGRYYTTTDQLGNDVVRLHPAARDRINADDRIRRWLIEFGMTPSSRAKVARSEGKDDDPASKYLT